MNEFRLRRLQADYETLRVVLRVHPEIQVEGVSGSPPDRYRLRLRVNSLQERGGQIDFVDSHLLEIRLPQGYPRDPPVCRMLTPVFHPNIAPHAVCIGDHWAAAESLDALIIRICEMLAFQSYNIKSPLNGEAARWVQENLDRLPLDAVQFIVAGELHSENATNDMVCSNCGELSTAQLVRCSKEHRLCAACVNYCTSCGQLLCLVCGTLQCPSCVSAYLAAESDHSGPPAT